jgi:hypothetical protein
VGRFRGARGGGLVEDGHAERLRLVELGAGLFAGDEVVGLLADGAGDAAAGGFDHLLGGLAGEGGERAGEDEGEAFEGGGGDALLGEHGEAECALRRSTSARFFSLEKKSRMDARPWGRCR